MPFLLDADITHVSFLCKYEFYKPHCVKYSLIRKVFRRTIQFSTFRYTEASFAFNYLLLQVLDKLTESSNFIDEFYEEYYLVVIPPILVHRDICSTRNAVVRRRVGLIDISIIMIR